MAERKSDTTHKVKNNVSTRQFVRKMSKDPTKGKQLRRKVYEAVVKTLLKRRSGSFTLDEIAARIGGSKGIIYYYFKSKGDLLYELNQYFWGFIQEAMAGITKDPNLTAREKLTTIITRYIQVSCEHWQLADVLWNDAALGEVSNSQARTINKSRRLYIDDIAGLVDRIIKEENMEPVNPKVAALMIFGVLVYVSTWYKKGGSLTANDIADYAVKMAFQGIISKKQSS
jgi:AcrR family transcriptional regulator